MPAARLLHTTASDAGGYALISLLTGDVRAVLPTLPDRSVQMVVTSPPYFGLRDYGTAQWEGGDAECEHIEVSPQNRPGRETPGGRGGTFPTSERAYRDICGKCGARRIDAQLGLEPTPDAYIATMVEVFREVRRILRPDGCCFINMGDNYADKQLQMMPARLALALQADQWILRSDIIWAKPNPMPESCRDRPTSAHEHVFLLTKRSKYYYDIDAVREPQDTSYPDHPSYRAIVQPGRGSPNGMARQAERREQFGVRGASAIKMLDPRGRSCRNVWVICTSPYSAAHFATFPPELAERCIRAGSRPGDTILDPFSGAGTALLVADRLGRDSIGIDLNHAYVEMARERLQRDCPLFAEINDAPIPEPPEDERMADLFAEAAE